MADKASIRAVLALLLTGLIFGLIWLTGGAHAQVRAQEQLAEASTTDSTVEASASLPSDPPLQTLSLTGLVDGFESSAATTFSALAVAPTSSLPLAAVSSTTASDSMETTTIELAETTTTVAQTTTTHDHPSTTVAETTTTTQAPPTTTTLASTTTTTEPPSATTTPTTPEYSGVLSESQARQLFSQYFSGDDVEVALRIAICESSLNTNAYNPAGYGGLFQHSISAWDSRAEAAGWAGASIYDGQANTAVAYWLFSQSGWSPWPNC